jgi:flagellar biosynthesis protein FliR
MKTHVSVQRERDFFEVHVFFGVLLRSFSVTPYGKEMRDRFPGTALSLAFSSSHTFSNSIKVTVQALGWYPEGTSSP